VPAAVAKLRAEPGGEIRLVVYPLVLGAGKKLFSDGFPLSRLALVETRALPGGVVVTTYRRADAD
jgi:hypothetical protein